MTYHLSTKKINHSSLTKNIEQIPFIQISILELNKQNFNPTKFDSIIITSKNSVEAIQNISELKKLPVICVGHKTKTLLLSYGYTVFKTYPNAQTLVEHYPNHSLNKSIYFKGNLAMTTIQENIPNLKIVLAYRTELKPTKVKAQKYKSILFFSPSAVKSYYTANPVIPSQIAICIGQTTANAVKEFHHNIKVAKNNSLENMLKIINNLTL